MATGPCQLHAISIPNLVRCTLLPDPFRGRSQQPQDHSLYSPFAFSCLKQFQEIPRSDPRSAQSVLWESDLQVPRRNSETAGSHCVHKALCALRGSFFIARPAHGTPLGSGGFRGVTYHKAKVKGLYRRPGTFGIGQAVRSALQAEAKAARSSSHFSGLRFCPQYSACMARTSSWRVCSSCVLTRQTTKCNALPFES